MKKTFLVKRNALLSSASVSWGAVALACAVLVLLLRLLAPNFFLHTFAPAFRVADTIAAKSNLFFDSFGDVALLAAKNEQLRIENTALANENQALQQKAASVSALIGTPGSSRTAISGILAGVVARPPESPYDTLVLAAGSQEGVILGMEAFGGGGVPLGAVSAVMDDFSRVTLFSAPGMVTRGWVGRAGLPIDILGGGGGAMNASLSRSANVAVGDTVFAPGPGMLPIGSVVRIDSDPSAPEVVLHIMPALNLFSVSWVELRDTGTALRNSFFAATSTP
jgi:cell shape-determining protein MreC